MAIPTILGSLKLTPSPPSATPVRSSASSSLHFHLANSGAAALVAASLLVADPALAFKGGGPYGQQVTRGQDLTGKDFSGQTLIRQDFKTSILRQANFKGAKLLGASFFDADLTGADLSDADLRGADFSLANVSKVNLTNANLEGALATGNTTFKGSNIYGAGKLLILQMFHCETISVNTSAKLLMGDRSSGGGGRGWAAWIGEGSEWMSRRSSRSPPVLTIALVVLGVIILIAYFNSGSGVTVTSREAVSRSEGSCTPEVMQALPYLKKAYGNELHKVLHVGPDSCTVVSNLLKEGKVEAWGVEPYDLEDTDSSCKSLVRKGFVRMADIKFPLPYRQDSFNLVIVSDALDYLTPRYLNKTLPDLARISTDGLVIFAGNPGQQKAKVSELPKFGRPAKLRSSSWWSRYFIQTGLRENEGPLKKFEQAASKNKYKPDCQIFHLSS
uniref:Uncharacterized protein n=1 Tax=Oryza rufipogon TaxID=4529 RepID=A0A0E0MR83_ORYRU